MSSRASFFAATVLLGGALWWMFSRPPGTPTPTPAPAPDSAVAARSHREPAPRLALAGPESVEDVPGDTEPAIDGATPSEDPARVTPPPRTIKLGAVEDSPAAPPWDPTVGASVPGSDGEDEAVSELPPVTLLENYRSAFRQYAAKFGGNPVGDNAEITAALKGGNPRQSILLTSGDGLRVNEKGQAVDSWGTPYFFHQLSRSEMEIRSAGPDRRMWTTDDLVLR